MLTLIGLSSGGRRCCCDCGGIFFRAHAPFSFFFLCDDADIKKENRTHRDLILRNNGRHCQLARLFTFLHMPNHNRPSVHVVNICCSFLQPVFCPTTTTDLYLQRRAETEQNCGFEFANFILLLYVVLKKKEKKKETKEIKDIKFLVCVQTVSNLRVWGCIYRAICLVIWLMATLQKLIVSYCTMHEN